MARFEERFEVGDSVCHVIGYTATWKAAYGLAGIAAATGHRSCPGIIIYDRMAHRGKPELWDAFGRCLQIKNKLAGA